MSANIPLRLLPCLAYPSGPLTPGDCWFARDSTEAERLRTGSHLQAVAQRRWAWWADRDRLLDDSEIAPQHAGIRPLFVVLPNGLIFVSTTPRMASTTLRKWHRAMDEWVAAEPGRSWDKAWDAVPCGAFEPGWQITNPEDPARISLSPSIHFDPGGKSEWHGHLTNGVLIPC